MWYDTVRVMCGNGNTAASVAEQVPYGDVPKRLKGPHSKCGRSAQTEAFYAFLRRGHRIRVVHRSRLLAVTVNPTAPSGLVLDSRRLCEAMQEALQIPVYDVKKMPE